MMYEWKIITDVPKLWLQSIGYDDAFPTIFVMFRNSECHEALPILFFCWRLAWYCWPGTACFDWTGIEQQLLYVKHTVRSGQKTCYPKEKLYNQPKCKLYHLSAFRYKVKQHWEAARMHADLMEMCEGRGKDADSLWVAGMNWVQIAAQ